MSAAHLRKTVAVKNMANFRGITLPLQFIDS